MKNYFYLMLLLFTFSAVNYAQNAKTESAIPFDANVKKGTLSNGLTYYIRKNAKP